MAAHFIVGSRFRPFSYEEMLAPLKAYTDEYNLQQEAYNQLGEQASLLEELTTDNPGNFKARSLYENYTKDLNQAAAELANSGLNPNSRRNLNTMRERYKKEITPVENAYQRRQQFIDEQRQLLSKDDSLMFDVDASRKGLDYFLNNPEATYTPISGNDITKRAASAAKNLIRDFKDPDSKWKSILGGQYYETIRRNGYRPEEILSAINRNPEALKELTKIMDDAVLSTGIDKWNNQELLDRAYDYAGIGLWEAVGQSTPQILQNRGYGVTRGVGNTPTDGGPRSNSHSYYDISKVSKKDRKLLEKLKAFDKNPLEYQKYLELMNFSSRVQDTPGSNFIKQLFTGEDNLKDQREEESRLDKLAQDYYKLPKTIRDNLLSADEIERLKIIGVDENTSLEEVALRLEEAINHSQAAYTGYTIELTDPKYAEQDIQSYLDRMVMQDPKLVAVKEVESGLELSEDMKLKDFKKAITKEDSNGNAVLKSISNIEFIPELGGVTVSFVDGPTLNFPADAFGSRMEWALRNADLIKEMMYAGLDTSDLLSNTVTDLNSLFGYGKNKVQSATSSKDPQYRYVEALIE